MWDWLFSIFKEKQVQEERSTGQCPFRFPKAEDFEELPEVQPLGLDTYHEFDKVICSFNIATDILVLSRDYIKDFDEIYKAKLELFEDKVIYFDGSTLLNVAIIRAGYSYGFY